MVYFNCKYLVTLEIFSGVTHRLKGGTAWGDNSYGDNVEFPKYFWLHSTQSRPMMKHLQRASMKAAGWEAAINKDRSLGQKPSPSFSSS